MTGIRFGQRVLPATARAHSRSGEREGKMSSADDS